MSLLLFFLVIVFFIPQIMLIGLYSKKTYISLDQIPEKDYGVLLGALVYDDDSLSDVVRERSEAAVLLYKKEKVEKIFVSGDNRHNKEVENISNYLVNNEVQKEDIVQDFLGIDTNDTCRHFSSINNDAILITQGFHLPRAMYMCDKNGIDVLGIKANYLGVLKSRGDNSFQVAYIRIKRFLRESLLTWSYILGIYDSYSQAAEIIERDKTS